MAKQPKTKTAVKTKKPDSSAPKPEAAKAETPKSEATESTSNDSTGTADSADAGGGKKSSAASRSISYFSSVSNEDYRSGWDDIFGSGKKKSARQPAAKKKNDTLPLTITLDADDLDATTRKRLENVFRAQVKKKRLNYDKLSGNGQVNWQITCRISKA
jgi:hypothetical protein